MPVRRVLVATDLSARAHSAVRRATLLAAAHGAHLTVLFVVDPALDDDLVAFAEEELRTHACDAAGTASELGHSPVGEPDTLVRGGSPADTVLAEARQRDVDLLVVGAHGARGVLGAFAGSTTDTLVQSGPCPVLVVRTPVRGDYGTVLLAVDDTDVSRRAARFGTSVTPSAAHVVAHVSVVIGERLLRLSGRGEPEIDQLREASTAGVRPRIERLASELRPEPVSVVVGSGTPHSALPALAARYEADLVVTGSGSSSLAERALLGSVAQNVVRHAPSDVLVVRGR